MRYPVLMLCAAVLAVGCGASLVVDPSTGAVPPPVHEAPRVVAHDEPPSIHDQERIQDVLDEVAAAFRAGDDEALRDHLHDPGSAFGQRWLARARRMADLPLATYRLRLDDVVPDLATQRVRSRYDGRVQVVYAVEELGLDGADTAPAEEDLFLTMVRGDAGWQVAGDRDGESLGFVSVDHLWDHGDVTVTRQGPVLAVHHPDGPPIGALLDETAAAVRDATERLPLSWPGRVVVIVPRDEEELGELLHVTFDLSNFVAFATATPTGELGQYELTGSRVVVNPGNFLDRSPSARQQILTHEMVHVATRPSAGPMMPSWLEEGIAQVFGDQRSSTGTGLVDAVATGGLELPTDGQFTVGGRDRIFLSYQLAWSFVDHLLDRFGPEDVGAFYRELGRGSVGKPGTQARHLDRAARATLHVGIDELVDEWRAAR